MICTGFITLLRVTASRYFTDILLKTDVNHENYFENLKYIFRYSIDGKYLMGC